MYLRPRNSFKLTIKLLITPCVEIAVHAVTFGEWSTVIFGSSGCFVLFTYSVGLKWASFEKKLLLNGDTHSNAWLTNSDLWLSSCAFMSCTNWLDWILYGCTSSSRSLCKMHSNDDHGAPEIEIINLHIQTGLHSQRFLQLLMTLAAQILAFVVLNWFLQLILTTLKLEWCLAHQSSGENMQNLRRSTVLDHRFAKLSQSQRTVRCRETEFT